MHLILLQASSDEVQAAIDLGRSAIELTFWLALPLLAVGLIVGVIVSILQAATSLQEQTLTFVPKMAAVAIVLIYIFPWLVNRLSEYMVQLFDKLPALISR
ncbi:MAG: flagellar biosynthesis protein FliQ [Planctomycetes bacterium]|nr:flagellar biosynthesis protein FliQ [Planctomycetota bacterium]